MRVWNWLKTVPTLVVIGSILFIVLSVGGGLLLWGANFASNYVHNQLSEQKIYLPQRGAPSFDPKTYPELQQYAGQAVDNGPKAKAYANEFIKVHLREVDHGRTYAQESALSRANPSDTKLKANVDTLFRGETLRGILLNVWGWATMGAIAWWVGLGSLLGALVVLAALVTGFVAHERQVNRAKERGEQVPARGDGSEVPVTVG